MGRILKSAEVTKDDLQKINKYTRRNFKEDEVYTFSLVLCDNDIDRDYERFTVEALFELEKMFLGKTGIFDHNPKAENQSARIYECKVEAVNGKKTAYGDDYFRLTAKAYIPVSKNTENLILSIDSGILKEVSLGCSVGEKLCSVCGKEQGECHHIKGKKYGNDLCCYLLNNPTDAYEWSFVAVPAQKQAGVHKRGRMLVSSYEALRFQRLDLFTVTLNQIGAYISRAQLKDAVDVLISGDGNDNPCETIAAASTGTVSYEDLLKLWAGLNPYELNTILAPTSAMQKIMSLSEMKDAQSGLTFQGTGKMITPLGASLLHTPEISGNKIIGLDKNCALEMVQAGDVITDYDKLIDRQLERASISCISGFGKIFKDASKALTY